MSTPTPASYPTSGALVRRSPLMGAEASGLTGAPLAPLTAPQPERPVTAPVSSTPGSGSSSPVGTSLLAWLCTLALLGAALHTLRCVHAASRRVLSPAYDPLTPPV